MLFALSPLLLTEIPYKFPIVYSCFLSLAAILSGFNAWVCRHFEGWRPDNVHVWDWLFFLSRYALVVSSTLMMIALFAWDGFLSWAGFIAITMWVGSLDMTLSLYHVRLKHFYWTLTIIALPVLLSWAMNEQMNIRDRFVVMGIGLFYSISLVYKAGELHRKFRDILSTRQKVDDEKDLMQKLFDIIPAKVSWLDKNFQYKMINRNLSEYLKKPSQQLVGSEFGFMQNPENKVLNHKLQDFRISSLTESFFEHPVRVGEEIRRHHVILKKIESSEGTEIIMMSLDIEDLRLAQEKLKEEELKSIHTSRLAALGEMGTGMAHEILNPLAMIRNALELVRLDYKIHNREWPFLMEKMKIIDNHITRINLIIDGLKNLSRDYNSKDMNWNSVAVCLDDVINISTEKLKNNGVNFVYSAIAREVELYCLPHQIGQVVLNLINNAYDEIKNQKQKQIEITTELRKGEFVISVADNGAGAQDAKKLFQPFYTTKPAGQGTGLGLSISRQILNAHRAELVYRREQNRTIFDLVFVNHDTFELWRQPLSNKKSA